MRFFIHLCAQLAIVSVEAWRITWAEAGFAVRKPLPKCTGVEADGSHCGRDACDVALVPRLEDGAAMIVRTCRWHRAGFVATIAAAANVRRLRLEQLKRLGR